MSGFAGTNPLQYQILSFSDRLRVHRLKRPLIKAGYPGDSMKHGVRRRLKIYFALFWQTDMAEKRVWNVKWYNMINLLTIGVGVLEFRRREKGGR